MTGSSFVANAFGNVLPVAASVAAGGTFALGHGPTIGILWQVLGCVAGALTALYFRPWEGMTKKRFAFSMFVAASFAFFVTPMVFAIEATRESGGRFYLMATGAFILIPWAIKRLKLNVDSKLGGDE